MDVDVSPLGFSWFARGLWTRERDACFQKEKLAPDALSMAHVGILADFPLPWTCQMSIW